MVTAGIRNPLTASLLLALLSDEQGILAQISLFHPNDVLRPATPAVTRFIDLAARLQLHAKYPHSEDW